MELVTISRKSSSSSVINNVAPLSGKPNNMQLFVQTYVEYKQHRTEKLTTELVRYLQLLSVAIDYSIFDPTTSFGLDFFLCLQELLSKVEQHSTISWCCVNVLKTACKNPTTRTSLITNYHFINPLCELLNDELETEKKIKILRLMQELTCGINISWQISYLPHLMIILSRWIVNENQDIIILSLAILVNLCYKNLPSIYTLCRCIDVKALLRHCLHGLEGPKVEMQVCKLLIILDYMDGSVPNPLVKKLITVLFTTIFESFKGNDSFYMRHSLEFFMDFRVKHADVDMILKNEDCEHDIKTLLEDNLPSDTSTHSPPCVSTLLSFLNALAHLLNPTLLPPFYRRILHLSLQWLHTDTVSTHALTLIRAVVMHKGQTMSLQHRELCVIQEDDEKGLDLEEAEHDETVIDDMILESLPLLRVIVDCVDQVVSVEESKTLVAVVELFRVLVGMEKYREEVIELLQDVNLNNIFEDILKGPSDNACCKLEVTSMEAVTLYVNYMAIINELSKYRQCWLMDILTLLKHKQMHNILSQALYQGNEDTKNIVLMLASTPGFPTKDVAKVMNDMNNMVLKTDTISDGDKELVGRIYPILSNNQSQRLDDLLNQIRENVAEKGHLYASATDIIELYDYKIASLRESEEMSKNSLNAASDQCVQFQTKAAQLTAEANRLQLQLIGVEERYDNVLISNDELKNANEELATQVKDELRKRMMMKEDYNVEIEEKAIHIEELESKLEVLDSTLTYNEAKNKRNHDKLVQDIKIKDAIHADTLRVVAKLNKDLQTAQTNNEMQTKKIRNLENRLQDKNKALDKANKEITDLQERLKIILKVVTK